MRISMQSSLGHLAIFLIIFEAHMNILVNIKVEIMSIFSFSLNDHIAYLFTNTSIFEPRMFSKFWTIFFLTHVFFMSVFRYTLYHTPLKYKCPFKMMNWIRPATVVTTYDLVAALSWAMGFLQCLFHQALQIRQFKNYNSFTVVVGAVME